VPCDIVMPQLGLTMTEGSIVAWLKKVGDWVENGEPLFTVETDKVEMEVESMGSGYLSPPLVDLGQIVPVGTVIARLTDDKEC
jgi:pyruvate/2-oxoglutarate dehydrogenase complex dihydrolipoamide acyltransferase (E2) component